MSRHVLPTAPSPTTTHLSLGQSTVGERGMNVCTLSLQPPFFFLLCKRVRVLMASNVAEQGTERCSACCRKAAMLASLRLPPGVVAVVAVDQEGPTGEI